MCTVTDFVKRLGLSLAPCCFSVESYLMNISAPGVLESQRYHCISLYSLGLLLGKAVEARFPCSKNTLVSTLCERSLLALKNMKDENKEGEESVLYALARAVFYAKLTIPNLHDVLVQLYSRAPCMSAATGDLVGLSVNCLVVELVETQIVTLEGDLANEYSRIIEVLLKDENEGLLPKDIRNMIKNTR